MFIWHSRTPLQGNKSTENFHLFHWSCFLALWCPEPAHQGTGEIPVSAQWRTLKSVFMLEVSAPTAIFHLPVPMSHNPKFLWRHSKKPQLTPSSQFICRPKTTLKLTILYIKSSFKTMQIHGQGNIRCAFLNCLWNEPCLHPGLQTTKKAGDQHIFKLPEDTHCVKYLNKRPGV